MVTDTHFAGAGFAHFDLHQVHLLGAAMLVNLDGTRKGGRHSELQRRLVEDIR